MGENLKNKELKKVIKEFDFVPSFNRIIVTVNRVENEDGIITTEDAISGEQYVVASGNTSKFEAGDRIELDFARLTVREPSQNDKTKYVERIRITPFQHKGRVYTIVSDNDLLGKYK